MKDKTKEWTMGLMVMSPCRSRTAQAFDACPACAAAALDAIGQAGLYVLGRAVPEMAGGLDEPLEMAYSLDIRLSDEEGVEIGSDQLEAGQSISLVEQPDDFAGPFDEEAGPETPDDADVMTLDDFQTVIDRIELAPAGPHGVEGTIAGTLLGFDRPIGVFEIRVLPA